MPGQLAALAAFLLTVVITLSHGPASPQQARRLYRVGALTGAWAPNHPAVEGLKAGLKELGFEEGRDVTFDIRFTEGKTEAFPAAAAALVNEFAHPGGNASGVSGLFTELAPKRLEVLKAVIPTLRRVWAIYYADDPQSLAATRKAEEAAPPLKVELVARPVRTPEELASSLKAVRRGDGLIAPDVAALDIPDQILQKSLSARIPVVFGTAFWAGYGALVSYGADYHAQGRQAARLVAKILRGVHPQDLPVEGANKIELVINLKTAKRLGVTIPREILLRADKVIE